MMIAPETYIDELKGKTMDECLEERDGIYQLLKDVETGNYDETQMYTDHPARQYGYYLKVFALINELIAEKYEKRRDGIGR